MSIGTFSYELDMDNQLRAAYYERWYRLMELIDFFVY